MAAIDSGSDSAGATQGSPMFGPHWNIKCCFVRVQFRMLRKFFQCMCATGRPDGDTPWTRWHGGDLSRIEASSVFLDVLFMMFLQSYGSNHIQVWQRSGVGKEHAVTTCEKNGCINLRYERSAAKTQETIRVVKGSLEV